MLKSPFLLFFAFVFSQPPSGGPPTSGSGGNMPGETTETDTTTELAACSTFGPDDGSTTLAAECPDDSDLLGDGFPPYIYGYHLHPTYDSDDSSDKEAMENFAAAFESKYGISDCPSSNDESTIYQNPNSVTNTCYLGSSENPVEGSSGPALFSTGQYGYWVDPKWLWAKDDNDQTPWEWVQANSDGRSILLHSVTGCMLHSHTEWVMWLGAPISLGASELDNYCYNVEGNILNPSSTFEYCVSCPFGDETEYTKFRDDQLACMQACESYWDDGNACTADECLTGIVFGATEVEETAAPTAECVDDTICYATCTADPTNCEEFQAMVAEGGCAENCCESIVQPFDDYFCSEKTPCTDNASCGDDYFCNFDDTTSGNCEACAMIDDGCSNAGFATQEGEQACSEVCEETETSEAPTCEEVTMEDGTCCTHANARWDWSDAFNVPDYPEECCEGEVTLDNECPVVECPEIHCVETCESGYIEDNNGCNTCECVETDCEVKAAPTNEVGYIPSADVMIWPDVNQMPEECLPIFWNSDGTEPGSYEQVPDVCCDANAGAGLAVPLTDLWPQTDNCFVFDPVGDRSFIYGTWAGGCSDDGTFFYGEKCGGSDFGAWEEAAYGQCSQPDEMCHCIGTVETQGPGCFAIATIIPPAGDVQDAVFLRVEGCIIPEPEPTEIEESTKTPTMTPAQQECLAEPMSPPVNGNNMVPDGALLFYSDYTQVPEECGAPCFEYDCYNKVPDLCCDGADNQYFEMADLFTDTTCFGPEKLGPYDIYFAGGCSEDGEFFYGEQCGGSTFGPFAELGYGVCEQPEETCNCNAYVSTNVGGCYTVGTPPGVDEQYFMRVNEAVCLPAATESPSVNTESPSVNTESPSVNTCDVYSCDSDLQSAVMDIMTHVESLTSSNEALLSRISVLESRVEELEKGSTENPSASPSMAPQPTEMPSELPSISPSEMPTQQYYEVPSLNNLRCAWGTEERVFTKYGETFLHCIRLCRNDPDCEFVGIRGTACIGCAVTPHQEHEGWVTYSMSPYA